jgi:hypothetical protein
MSEDKIDRCACGMWVFDKLCSTCRTMKSTPKRGVVQMANSNNGKASAIEVSNGGEIGA